MKKSCQSITEYAIFIGAIVVALIAMQVYYSRAVRGNIKRHTDAIGEQFNLKNGNYILESKSVIGQSVQQGQYGLATPGADCPDMGAGGQHHYTFEASAVANGVTYNNVCSFSFNSGGNCASYLAAHKDSCSGKTGVCQCDDEPGNVISVISLVQPTGGIDAGNLNPSMPYQQSTINEMGVGNMAQDLKTAGALISDTYKGGEVSTRSYKDVGNPASHGVAYLGNVTSNNTIESDLGLQ